MDRWLPELDDDISGAMPTYVRRLDATESAGAVTLVGVVHDHPASSYRVRRVVEAVDPDVLALELPSLAVALPAVRASSSDGLARADDEMTAGIRASESARVVGIDAPSGRYVTALVRECIRENHSLRTVGSLGRDLSRSLVRAVRWRLGAVLEGRFGVETTIGDSEGYDVDPTDPVSDLLAGEARHVSVSRAFRNAVATPGAVDVIDAVRERTMAARLDELRAHGDVVAVLGLSHLDPIAERLYG